MFWALHSTIVVVKATSLKAHQHYLTLFKTDNSQQKYKGNGRYSIPIIHKRSQFKIKQKVLETVAIKKVKV